MKAGAESRKKTIAAGALGAVALCCIVYAYSALFGGSSPAPAAPATVTTTAANVPAAATEPVRASDLAARQGAPGAGNTLGAGSGPAGAAPGVDAVRLAKTTASLDPTLDESAMLRTERLVYSGSGRNIFSAAAYVPAAAIPKYVPPARPRPKGPVGPPVPAGPPPPPPINLKFFGTAKRQGSNVQAFLLSGDNVYLASAGEIVAHKYKILAINLNSIQVQDLENNNTQMLPRQTQ
ncbi:MAG TPA: hypothetical protein VHY48_04350 [Acidobacteriaceae bacterium]|jgi:hypothetical protein|nr:hypothetical protein [Acidobacteriaceae bacterium]